MHRIVLLVAACAAGIGYADGLTNIALGKPYTFSTPPQYKHCTDPGDNVQLTDGRHSATNCGRQLWVHKGTVGWNYIRDGKGAQMITVDLGKSCAMSGFAYTLAAGCADVAWPAAIGVYVSEDKKTWVCAGDLRRNYGIDLEHVPIDGVRPLGDLILGIRPEAHSEHEEHHAELTDGPNRILVGEESTAPAVFADQYAGEDVADYLWPAQLGEDDRHQTGDGHQQCEILEKRALAHSLSVAPYLVTLRPCTPAAVAALAFAFSRGLSARTASPAFHISLSCISWSFFAMNSL